MIPLILHPTNAEYTQLALHNARKRDLYRGHLTSVVFNDPCRLFSDGFNETLNAQLTRIAASSYPPDYQTDCSIFVDRKIPTGTYVKRSLFSPFLSFFFFFIYGPSTWRSLERTMNRRGNMNRC